MKFELVIFFLASLYNACQALKGTAQLTYYWSYAPCCKASPNYNPSFPTTECDYFGACNYLGLFAAYPDKKSFDWVKQNNIVAFYDASDRYGKYWYTRYAKRQIRLSKNGKTFVATIADTCGDNDCNGCCYRNSKGGYLVDLEYYTVMRNLGSTSAASGTIDFEIV